MQKRIHIIPIALTLVRLLFVSTAHAQEQTFVLRQIHFEKGGRVVGLEVLIDAGSFVAIEPLPMGWFLTIDNDPSQQTSLKGDAGVGTAALEPRDLRNLRIRTRAVVFGGQRFSVSGTLVVTEDFQHERRIPLSLANFKSVNHLAK